MPKRLVRDWETGWMMEVTVPADELPRLAIDSLKKGDIITFEMGPVKLSIKVINPVLRQVVPCKWRWMRGLMELRCAINPDNPQEMVEMSVVQGWGLRLGHPDNASCFIDLAPTERILLNGRPIE